MGLVSVTVTPGTMAPDWSRTFPSIVPTCSDWATLLVDASGTMSSHASTTIEPLGFINIPPASGC